MKKVHQQKTFLPFIVEASLARRRLEHRDRKSLFYIFCAMLKIRYSNFLSTCLGIWFTGFSRDEVLGFSFGKVEATQLKCKLNENKSIWEGSQFFRDDRNFVNKWNFSSSPRKMLASVRYVGAKKGWASRKRSLKCCWRESGKLISQKRFSEIYWNNFGWGAS